nr:12343_t:CDS:2 [Entrophospora candida]
MLNQVSRIIDLLLEEPLVAICSTSVVYLMMDDDTLGSYEDVEDLVSHAVKKALKKMDDSNSDQRDKIMDILPEIYDNFLDLQDRELIPYHTEEEIEWNLNFLKTKLDSPFVETNTNLYGSIRESLESVSLSDLTCNEFEKEAEGCFYGSEYFNIWCDEFVEHFNDLDISRNNKNIFHNKTWKEDETKLVKRTERILNICGEIQSNPAFKTSMSCSEQSKGTYVTNVVVPLL